MDGGGRPRGRGAVRPDTWQQVGHLTGEPKTCVTGSLHRPGALHGDLALEYQTAAAARQRVYYYRDLPGATEWSFSGSTTDYPFTGGYDRGVIYVFDLPASFDTPAPQRYDFQEGGTGAWQPIAGSQLSVTTSGYSQVYRESNLEGDTGALLANADWPNQSIQADLEPVAFSGSDRRVGLAARWQDADNYYYVTLRSSPRVAAQSGGRRGDRSGVGGAARHAAQELTRASRDTWKRHRRLRRPRGDAARAQRLTEA